MHRWTEKMETADGAEEFHGIGDQGGPPLETYEPSQEQAKKPQSKGSKWHKRLEALKQGNQYDGGDDAEKWTADTSGDHTEEFT